MSTSTTLAGLADTSNASSASNGQVLVYDSTSDQWIPSTISSNTVSNATSSTPGLIQLSGDLGNNATSPTVSKIQGVSTPSVAPSTGQVLTATSASTANWSTPSSAPVSSVFGRTGVVIAVNGDYTASQVGALPSTDDLSAVATANLTAGNVNLNSHKITNLQNGSSLQDAAAFGQIPTSLPPSGTAGGVLTGTYPNPSGLAATGVTAASYTNSNITIGADGRITAASNGSSSSSWYVTASGDSTGATDTTHLNTALTAARTAGEGRVQGVPGSTYYLNSYLVIGSGTTLDMTDCNIILASGAGGMVRNYSFTNVVSSASDASISSGSSIITSSLGASAAVGQTVIVLGAGGGGGGSYVSPLVGYVSATTSTTVTITNLNGSTLTASTTVSSATIQLFNRDSNIHIKGGYWNMGSGTGGQTNANYMLVGGHVDHYQVEVQGMTTDAQTRMNVVYDATDVYVDLPNIYTAGNVSEIAGCYAVGPVYNYVINRVTGQTYDDFVCISGTDALNMINSAGNIVGVQIRHVDGTSVSDFSIRIVSGAGTTFDDIVVTGVVTGSSNGVYLGDFPSRSQMIGGSYGYIDLGTLSIIASQQLTLVTPSATYIKANLDSNSGTGVYLNGGTSTTTIGTLLLTGSASAETLLSHNIGTVTINHLIINGLMFSRPSGSGYLVQMAVAGATIGTADIIGCYAIMNTSADLISLLSGSVLNYLNIIGGVCSGAAAIINDASAGSPVVTFSGGFTVSTANYVVILTGSGGTKSFTLAGCYFSTIANQAFHVTGTVSLVFRGSLMSTSSSFTMLSLSASQTVTAGDGGAAELLGYAYPAFLAPAVTTLTFNTTMAVNAALGNDFRVTLTASTGTLSNPTNPLDGQTIKFQVTQGTGGSFTLAYGSAYDFGTAGSPSLSTAAGKVDVLGFVYNAALSKWLYLGAALGN